MHPPAWPTATVPATHGEVVNQEAGQGVRRSELAALLLVIAGLAGLLQLLVLPGVFTIDEDNYLSSILALRDGSFSLKDTAGLPPSRELIFFDPAMAQRPVHATPVTPAPPPMYSFLAYPFAMLGFAGLFTLNILSFLAGGVLVFFFVRRLRPAPLDAWLAFSAYLLSGILIDYALGAWPHALSVSLSFAAVYLAMRARESGGTVSALAAGVLVGLAAGVRYQNVVYGAAVGLGLVLWSRRRWRVSSAYALGLAIPLLTSAWINRIRLGTLNPVTKGARYLSTPLLSAKAQEVSQWTDGLLALGTRVVDFSWLPFSQLWAGMGFQYDARTGAFLGVTAVRKALLQSAPWIVLAFAGLIAAWRRRPPVERARTCSELRALSLIVLAMFAVFFAAGTKRHEGVTANSRYLLELVPILAAVLPLVLPSTPGLRSILLGAGLGAGLALATLQLDPSNWVRHLVLLKVPLLLATALLALWLAVRRYPRSTPAFGAVLGSCLAWAFVVHVGDDLVATRQVRRSNLMQATIAGLVLPSTPSALLAAHPAAFGPLKLDRDVVLLSLAADKGADSFRMVDALLAKGRRVFFFYPLSPVEYQRRLLAGRPSRIAGPPGSPFVEILGAASTRTDVSP